MPGNDQYLVLHEKNPLQKRHKTPRSIQHISLCEGYSQSADAEGMLAHIENFDLP
jgi:hypothetical protein